MDGNKFPWSELRTQMRHPFARHAKRRPRDIFFARRAEALAFPDTIVSPWLAYSFFNTITKVVRAALSVSCGQTDLFLPAVLPVAWHELPPMIDSYQREYAVRQHKNERKLTLYPARRIFAACSARGA
jgi:hypothetical protein